MGGRLVLGKRWVVVACVLATCVGLYFTIWRVANWQLDATWKNHVESERADLKFEGDAAKDKFLSVYGGLRTISLLPSVRSIDGQTSNLTADSLANIQQIYNSLKTQLDLSEIYLLPVAFNPQRINPATGKFEEPVVVFDDLIVQGGKFAKADDPFNAAKAPVMASAPAGQEEVESAEYEVMVEQLRLFSKNHPRQLAKSALKPAMLSSPETITCDNTVFNKTLNDEDRLGIIFSVPFYGEDGLLRGMVSAIVRKNVITSFARDKSHSIVRPGGFGFSTAQGKTVTDFGAFVPDLLASNNDQDLRLQYAIDIRDNGGVWVLRDDKKSSVFYSSPEFRGIKSFAFWSMLAVTFAMCLALVAYAASVRRADSLRFAATHDALTGLPNRLLIERHIQQLINACSVKADEFQALFYLDLDKFKLVNDTMGHQVGDDVLKCAVEVIRRCLRQTDMVARIGGDEFVVLLSGMKSLDQIDALAKRITKEMKVPMKVGRQEAHIGTSIGIALIDQDTKSANDLLRHADLALFRAKAEERGNFRFYTSEMDAEREERRGFEADLKNALKNNEFVLHYQPIHNTDTSAVTGYEALVRWQHPIRGMVPPLSFIGIAEETGLINELGDWILRQACTDALKFDSDVRIAVNLSPVQFRNPALPVKILAILNQTGLSPRRLELEITEGVLLSDDATTITMLQQLRGVGVRIALDDFGTGYSSLSYLRKFEFDKVKIDRSFLSNIENDKEAVVLKAVTQLSSSMGMTTVAEGVETMAQLCRVREQGCTEVQGYYFSKPKPIAEIIEAQQNKIAAASQG